MFRSQQQKAVLISSPCDSTWPGFVKEIATRTHFELTFPVVSNPRYKLIPSILLDVLSDESRLKTGKYGSSIVMTTNITLYYYG